MSILRHLSNGNHKFSIDFQDMLQIIGIIRIGNYIWWTRIWFADIAVDTKSNYYILLLFTGSHSCI